MAILFSPFAYISDIQSLGLLVLPAFTYFTEVLLESENRRQKTPREGNSKKETQENTRPFSFSLSSAPSFESKRVCLYTAFT